MAVRFCFARVHPAFAPLFRLSGGGVKILLTFLGIMAPVPYLARYPDYPPNEAPAQAKFRSGGFAYMERGVAFHDTPTLIRRRAWEPVTSVQSAALQIPDTLVPAPDTMICAPFVARHPTCNYRARPCRTCDCSGSGQTCRFSKGRTRFHEDDRE